MRPDIICQNGNSCASVFPYLHVTIHTSPAEFDLKSPDRGLDNVVVGVRFIPPVLRER